MGDHDKPADGMLRGAVTPCFTLGTTIATPRGERAVETLVPGDEVITRDNGIRPIHWVGGRSFTPEALGRARHLRPIRIRAGALGHGLPERDMEVSPQHRLLVVRDRTALAFDAPEVFVPAKHLVNNRSILRPDLAETRYLHLLFDRHEVVLANGAWTESFQPTDRTLGGMGHAQRAEILEIFPELATPAGRRGWRPTRPTIRPRRPAELHAR